MYSMIMPDHACITVLLACMMHVTLSYNEKSKFTSDLAKALVCYNIISSLNQLSYDKHHVQYHIIQIDMQSDCTVISAKMLCEFIVVKACFYVINLLIMKNEMQSS